jgi:diguanylate cyclase (GGDEF)-like protein
LEQAMLVAERLRQNASIPIVSDELTVSITISLGLAMFNTAIPDVQGLLQRADQALYQAKESGRNCVCVYSASGENILLGE